MRERMINLFDLIAKQVRDKKDLFDREELIMQTLVNKGYHFEEADAALTLVQTLVQEREEDFSSSRRASKITGVRAMNKRERARFTTEAFGFVSRLARLGIISEEQRDDMLEKAMAVYTGRIDIQRIKALVALILFAGEHGHEGAVYLSSDRITDTAWN